MEWKIFLLLDYSRANIPFIKNKVVSKLEALKNFLFFL